MIAELISRIPPPRRLYAGSAEVARSVLDGLEREAGRLTDERSRAEALLAASASPVWQVRACAVRWATDWYPYAGSEAVILRLTHDSVDVVAFHAIRSCGTLRLRAAIPHLTRISGWPSGFTRPGFLRKPVGIGAALTKHALIQIFGSNDPDELERLEADFLGPFRALAAQYEVAPDRSTMVRIPAGPFQLGSPERSDHRFAYRDYVPEQIVELPEFLIDRLPVTNIEYAKFLDAVDTEGHMNCHPDEPLDKCHWPAHALDPRFNAPSAPVTGIDWYDAHAYAAWAGKKLPTEVQWEKAARGTDGRDYPWGSDWRPELANHAETCFGRAIETLDDWEEILRSVSDTYPVRPLWDVGSRPEGDSPYGVADMAGNVWEWTRTNFHSREDMDPLFRGREILDFTNRKEAFPVIRGGCWTSLPEMLRTCFRGKDLLTDRHFEIGFRCVSE